MQALKYEYYGNHGFMRIEMDDGKIEEVSVFCGTDYQWNTFRTTGDSDPKRREEIIAAFNELS